MRLAGFFIARNVAAGREGRGALGREKLGKRGGIQRLTKSEPKAAAFEPVSFVSNRVSRPGRPRRRGNRKIAPTDQRRIGAGSEPNHACKDRIRTPRDGKPRWVRGFLRERES
jgi:hypothetical protein